MSVSIPPWIYIVLGWAGLLLATVATIRVCQQNAPQSVVIENSVPAGTSHAH